MEDPANAILKALTESPLAWLFTGGGATLLVSKFFERRKAAADAKVTDAGAEVTLSQGAIGFATELRRDLNAQQARIEALELENRGLFRRVAELEVSEAAARAENSSLKAEVAALKDQLAVIHSAGQP